MLYFTRRLRVPHCQPIHPRIWWKVQSLLWPCVRAFSRACGAQGRKQSSSRGLPHGRTRLWQDRSARASKRDGGSLQVAVCRCSFIPCLQGHRSSACARFAALRRAHALSLGRGISLGSTSASDTRIYDELDLSELLLLACRAMPSGKGVPGTRDRCGE